MLWLFILAVLFFGFWKTVKFGLFCVAASVALTAVLLLFVFLGAA